jgi:VanZ family protein
LLGVGILYNSSLPTMPPSGPAWIGFVTAKAGHVVEFALLGWLLTAAFSDGGNGFTASKRWAAIVAVVAATIFAAIDETRQLFVYSRTGQVSDLAIDAASAVLGAWLRIRMAA